MDTRLLLLLDWAYGRVRTHIQQLLHKVSRYDTELVAGCER